MKYCNSSRIYGKKIQNWDITGEIVCAYAYIYIYIHIYICIYTYTYILSQEVCCIYADVQWHLVDGSYNKPSNDGKYQLFSWVLGVYSTYITSLSVFVAKHIHISVTRLVFMVTMVFTLWLCLVIA